MCFWRKYAGTEKSCPIGQLFLFCLFVCRFMPFALFLLIFQLVFAYKLTSDSSPLEEWEHLFDIFIIRFLREKVKQINMWTEREITCAQCEHMELFYVSLLSLLH